MEPDHKNPTKISSFSMTHVLNAIVYPSRKRKVNEEEQLSLPESKHVCQDRDLDNTSLIIGSSSENGSNSFPGYSNKTMLTDSNFEEEYCDSYGLTQMEGVTSEGGPSSSAGNNCLSNDDDDDDDDDDDGAADDYDTADDNEQIQEDHESLPDYIDHIDFISSEYQHEDVEQYGEQELENIFNQYNVNPNAYVISSQGWSANQVGQSGGNKPTIDQEFEQYFSELML